jgi:hypothetical protein
MTTGSGSLARTASNFVVEWLTLASYSGGPTALIPGILIEVFHSFPQSLQANSGIVLYRPPPLPSTSFPIHHSPIILSIDAVYSELLKRHR